MRLAIFSDVHANPIALDAVLADVEEHGGVDGCWVLGDLVSPGYDPAGVLRRLTALPNAQIVRGNTDRYTVEGHYPHLTVAQAQSDPSFVPQLYTVARVNAWAHGYLAGTGWLDWVAALSLELRLALPDGTRLLGVHAAPGRDDGPGVEPDIPEDNLRSFMTGCSADLVCVGHTHKPLERRVSTATGNVHVVNVGCLSPSRRASYALLEADSTGYQITLHYAAYDTEAVVQAIRDSRYLPNPEQLIARFATRSPAT